MCVTIYQNDCLPLRGPTAPETTHTTQVQAFPVCLSFIVTNKDLHREVTRVTQEEEVLLQLFKTLLGGTLSLDNLFSHLFILTNRASVGSKHDEWYIQKLGGPSASFWSANVEAYGNYR